MQEEFFYTNINFNTLTKEQGNFIKKLNKYAKEKMKVMYILDKPLR